MAASPAALAQKGPEGIDLYSRFALAGALGCSVTHGAFTPVDVYVVPPALAPLSPADNFHAASRPRFSLIPPPTTVV